LWVLGYIFFVVFFILVSREDLFALDFFKGYFLEVRLGAVSRRLSVGVEVGTWNPSSSDTGLNKTPVGVFWIDTIVFEVVLECCVGLAILGANVDVVEVA